MERNSSQGRWKMQATFWVNFWGLLRAGSHKKILSGNRVSGAANCSPAPENGKLEVEAFMFGLALP